MGDRLGDRPTVLHGKFSSWLPWHQPFLDDLLGGLDAGFRNVVVCNRVENRERFPRDDLVALKTRALLQPSAALVCASHLKERFAPRLLHAHFGWSGLRFLLLKPLLGIPLVVSFGGRDAGAQLDDPRLAPLYARLLDAADRIVCVSKHLAEAVLAAGAAPERVEVVHRGTDLSRFARVERRREPGAPLSLIMVGRLVEKKGHRDALEALARLRSSGSRATLTIVGAGPTRKLLEGEVARLGLGTEVVFVGSLDRDALTLRLAEADVLVHCSVTPADGDVEGIPNVVVEGAATGLPVVATRHGGLPEVVEDGRTGLLVPEGDPEALAGALRRLQDAATRSGLGGAGAARVREAFDLKRQVGRHASIYRELLEASPRQVAPPDEHLEQVRRAGLARPRPWDHALARAAALAGALDGWEGALEAAPRGLLDRAVEAPTSWPRPWRSAAELGIDLAARSFLRERVVAFRRRSVARTRAFDLEILEWMRKGGRPRTLPSGALARPLRDLAGEPGGPGSPWRRFRAGLAVGEEPEDG
jgi:colanic acid/amylovoran biosynthesis glycosyltransferase